VIFIVTIETDAYSLHSSLFIGLAAIFLVTALLETRDAFSALTLLVGRQDGHLTCKNGVVRCYICMEQGVNDLHIVQLMSLPPHHLLLH